MSGTLTMTVNGAQYAGFKTVLVSRGIETGPHRFELTAAPDLDESAGIYAVEDGQSVAIAVDGVQIISGFIEDVNTEYDAENVSVSVSGSSRLCDLVDCSTNGMQVKRGQSLLYIARMVCEPFSIDVSADSSAAAAVAQPFESADLALDAGQSPWEFLEELARIRAVLITSDAAGNIIFTRRGSGYADTDLVLGINIKAASGPRSHRSLFSEYIVNGQQSLWTSSDTGANSQPQAKIVGDATRYRPTVFMSDSPADPAACNEQAQWRQRMDYARSRGVTYTVQGWHQVPGGRLWMPNELTHVTDARNKLNSTEMLITEVRLILSERQGRITQLTVMPAPAFDRLAQVAGDELGLA